MFRSLILDRPSRGRVAVGGLSVPVDTDPWSLYLLPSCCHKDQGLIAVSGDQASDLH
jgi:hypothetical protein